MLANASCCLITVAFKFCIFFLICFLKNIIELKFHFIMSLWVVSNVVCVGTCRLILCLELLKDTRRYYLASVYRKPVMIISEDFQQMSVIAVAIAFSEQKRHK